MNHIHLHSTNVTNLLERSWTCFSAQVRLESFHCQSGWSAKKRPEWPVLLLSSPDQRRCSFGKWLGCYLKFENLVRSLQAIKTFTIPMVHLLKLQECHLSRTLRDWNCQTSRPPHPSTQAAIVLLAEITSFFCSTNGWPTQKTEEVKITTNG